MASLNSHNHSEHCNCTLLVEEEKTDTTNSNRISVT